MDVVKEREAFLQTFKGTAIECVGHSKYISSIIATQRESYGFVNQREQTR